MMESIEKLRTAARNMAKGRNLANHEECNLLLIIADEIEAEIAERYMLLPVDADGVPIHINDRMENNERVARIVLSDGEWEPSVYLEKLSNPRVLHEYFCYEISHFNPRTLEDVLADFARDVNVSHSDFISADGEKAYLLAAINETADEIRELMEVGR